MAESLAGKRALVTGAGARIGSRVALRLASQGVAVGVHHFRSEAGARAVVDEIRAAGGEAVALACDLGKEDGPRALAAAAIEALGHLEILVQCASRWEKTPVEEIDERSLDHALAVDLRAPVLLSTLLGRRMREEAGGAIVHLLDWSVER
ncbi:MAG: SDR family NAD(P)-dependent oxidoreductase, partial [Candidatus Eisenbacteria bacterium]|nr:SDR family NAD(P)-dependent oxidoreductase [Candidatus Eisenbacteria bacterium]